MTIIIRASQLQLLSNRVQNLHTTRVIPLAMPSERQWFILACLMVVFLCALLAGLAPIWFTLAAFCVFSAPHNFVEFRYFLARLPSRLGPFRSFFVTSFTGLAILFFMQVTVITLTRMRVLLPAQLEPIICVWNELLIIWVVALSVARYPQECSRLLPANLCIAILASIGNFCSPEIFNLCVSYVHALIGVWILDRELMRTRKDWVRPYRWCLLTVPLCIVFLIIWFYGQSSLVGSEMTLSQSIASLIFAPSISPLYLGLFAFLQMVHYGVWVFAMPIAAQSWKRWRLNRIAVMRNRQPLSRVMSVVLMFGLASVGLFWIGFRVDFATTNQVYATVATLHILAEIPLLFWLCES